jgi:hypothetical protein
LQHTTHLFGTRLNSTKIPNKSGEFIRLIKMNALNLIDLTGKIALLFDLPTKYFYYSRITNSRGPTGIRHHILWLS